MDQPKIRFRQNRLKPEKRKSKTDFVLKTQFTPAITVNEAEDHLDEEYELARKAGAQEIKHRYPESYFDIEYRHCLFKVRVNDPKIAIQKLKMMNPDEEFDAKRCLEVLATSRGTEKRNKVCAKFQEFNIKLRNSSIPEFFELEEPNSTAIVKACFAWKVPTTLESKNKHVIKLIPLN